MAVVRHTSPHISIYRKQITSVMSILHRITGVAMYAGTVVLIAFLLVVAYDPQNFEQMRELLASPVGKILLFGWSYAFFYHLLNGVRHLFWDIGKGFDMDSVNRTGVLAIIASIALTIIAWCIAYQNVGGL